MTAKIKVYVYSKCSTCQKALSFLDKHNVSYERLEITVTPPTYAELKQMLVYKGGEVKKLFNTSGILYREMQLSEKLKNMSEESALSLLQAHGMLVKRPFLLGADFGLLGFREADWLNHLSMMER